MEWENKLIKTPYREITQERVGEITREYINVEGETYDKIYSGAKKGDTPSTYWTHDPTMALWYAIKGDTISPTNRSGTPIIFEADVTEEIIDVYKDPETDGGLIDLEDTVKNYRVIEGPELAQFMEDNYVDGYYMGLHPEEYDRTIDVLRTGDERAMEHFFGPRITDVRQSMRTKDYKKRAADQYWRAFVRNGKLKTKDEVEKSWVETINKKDKKDMRVGSVYPSDREGKKIMMLTHEGKKIHAGAKGYGNWKGKGKNRGGGTHKNPKRRKSFRARHKCDQCKGRITTSKCLACKKLW